MAPEVRVVEDWRLLGSGGHEDGVFTMPAGHLMAQAAPGNIWEKDGQTYLTNGVQFWANGDHNLALQPVGQNGQVIERDAIYEILPRETKLRSPNTTNARGGFGNAVPHGKWIPMYGGSSHILVGEQTDIFTVGRLSGTSKSHEVRECLSKRTSASVRLLGLGSQFSKSEQNATEMRKSTSITDLTHRTPCEIG